MAKKIINAFLSTILLLSISACGQAGEASISNDEPTWQEQYDLGVRYLSDGNYEEAIIAFTAAIEIDPRQAPAYVGRGDAYSGTALLASGPASELPKEAVTFYESAVADYLTAVDLDARKAEVYLKAAEVYIALGDTNSAIDILSKGYEMTGAESLHERMTALTDVTDIEVQSENVTVHGAIIFNPDEYWDTWALYIEQYQNDNDNVRCSINTYGVRFEVPVQVTIEGQTVSIQEALLIYDHNLIDEDVQLHNDETDTNGSLIGPILEFQGYFYRNYQTQELEGPTYQEEDGVTITYYSYRPNGDYVFYMEGYEVL